MSLPNNLVGVMNPTIPVDQGIFEESTTMKCRLGTRLAVGDKVFHYSRLSTSANVLQGDLLCATVPIASHLSGMLTISVQTAGATFLTCSASAGNEFRANQYAEGYVTVASTGLAGGGIQLRIRSHTSGAQVPFYTYDTLPEAVAAGPAVLTPCIYNGVLQGNSPADLPVGVAPVDVTAGNYFWLQTWGLASIKSSTDMAHGMVLCVGVSGGFATHLVVASLTAGGLIIGKNLGSATISQATPVWLTINP
jgi:hypothetical protein